MSVYMDLKTSVIDSPEDIDAIHNALRDLATGPLILLLFCKRLLRFFQPSAEELDLVGPDGYFRHLALRVLLQEIDRARIAVRSHHDSFQFLAHEILGPWFRQCAYNAYLATFVLFSPGIF